MITDEIAEQLERAGLYRRAANRWTDVQMYYSISDSERNEARMRRNACINKIRMQKTLKREVRMAELYRAVNKLHRKMGLDLEAGNYGYEEYSLK